MHSRLAQRVGKIGPGLPGLRAAQGGVGGVRVVRHSVVARFICVLLHVALDADGLLDVVARISLYRGLGAAVWHGHHAHLDGGGW